MRIKEKRMKSFVSRANVLTQAKKQAEAAKVVNDGLQYYSNNVIKAISPYAAADAGMIVVVLRHLADEMESKNVGAKEFAEWLDEHTKKPPLTETQVVKNQSGRGSVLQRATIRIGAGRCIWSAGSNPGGSKSDRHRTS